MRRPAEGLAGALALAMVSACSKGSAPSDGAPKPSARAKAATIDTVSTSVARIAALAKTPARPVTFAADGLHARRRDPRAHVDVTLPLHGDGALWVRDATTGVAIAAHPIGRAPSAAQERGGFVAYAGAAAGNDVLHRASDVASFDGDEEWVVLGEPLGEPKLTYALTLGESAAGLRLVGNVLEVVDRYGTPRLRVPSPWVVDRDGRRVAAEIAVDGCAVDRSPRAPWHRTPTPPGADTCTMSVQWSDTGLVYPIVVDPGWTSTTAMSIDRTSFTLVTLADGTVLAAGGLSNNIAGSTPAFVDEATAEIYDPTSKTWAATAPMTTGHEEAASTLLSDGSVVVFPGLESGSIVELYDPTTGGWTTLAAPPSAHAGGTATALSSGTLLVAGGSPGATACDLFDPTTRTWSSAAALNVGRSSHGAGLIGSKVIVAGGYVGDGPGSGTLSSAEIYDPSADTWTPAQSMFAARGQVVGLVANTRFVVMGGDTPDATEVEAFDPSTSVWLPLTSMLIPRVGHRAAKLPTGQILVVGGTGETTLAPSMTPAETYDPDETRWSPAGSTADFVIGANDLGLALLSTGGALVAGGVIDVGVSDASRLDFALGAAACSENADCSSGYCVDGVCCDTACVGACVACSVAAGAAVDGTCASVAPGTVCGAPSCTVENAQTLACDTAGECAAIVTSCGLYGCNGTTDCNTTCATDADCSTTGYCAGTACVAKLPNGTATTDPGACANGHLADGVCCDAACVGPCEECDGAHGGTVGTCSPVAGAAKHGSCPGAGTDADPCLASACDGITGDECAGLVGADVPCSQESCGTGANADVATAAASCNGSGSCPTAATTTCAPYICDANACRTSCRSDSDCVSGTPCDAVSHVCAAATTCSDGHTALGINGDAHDCSPYACTAATGNCASSCATTSDCADGYSCDPSTGICGSAVATRNSAPSSGGCGIAPSHGPSDDSTWLAFGACAVAATTIVRRRRDEAVPSR